MTEPSHIQQKIEQERLHDDHMKKGGCVDGIVLLLLLGLAWWAMISLLFIINPIPRSENDLGVVIVGGGVWFINHFIAFITTPFVAVYLHSYLKEIWTNLLQEDKHKSLDDDVLDGHPIRKH